MFQSLKEKISDTLWSLSSDDADKNLADLVARGTSETLIAPEWGVNMQLVDIVNQQPTVMPDKLLKVLKRSVGKPNAKTQILTLTILETCIKNCVPQLYDALAHSELWFELVKMAADTSIARVDADVRDKILCLVEDYAKVLPQPEFREAYEYLLEQGIDFPVRSPDEQAPILTPPTAYQPPTVLLSGAAPPAGTAAATAAAAGLAHAGARGGGGDAAAGEGADPFAGMSAEDRAAVQAAMAEMEEEERAVRESAALAASTALFQQMGLQQGAQQAPHAASGAQQQQQQQQQRVAGQQGAGHAAPAPAADPGPVLPDNPEEALQVIANTTGLLNEMMASETDPREGFVVELAEQCVRFRSKLEDIINTLTDEAQLASALAHYEALQAAVTKYDEHLSRAEQGAALVQPAAGLASRPLQQPGEAEPFAVAAAAAAPAGYVAPSFLPPSGGSTAGPNFTLLDEDDEEDQGDALLSSKRAGAGAEPAPAPTLAHTPAPAVAAAPAVATPAPAANLIDLDLLAPSAAPAHAAAASAAEPLAAAPTPAVPASVATPSPVEQLDRLLDGLTVADPAPAPAPASAPALAPAAATTPSSAPEDTQA